MSIQAKTESALLTFAISIIGVTAMRYFLECFSNPNLQTGELYDLHKFLHYTLFYFSMFLSFVVLAWIFTRKSPLTLIQDFLPFSSLILLPPILDLLLSGGTGKNITYFLLPASDLFKNFYTFGYLTEGITSGLQITAAIILVLLGAYVFKKTNNFFQTILCFFLTYLIIFGYAALPNLFLFLTFSDFSVSASDIFKQTLTASLYFNRQADSLTILTEKFSAILFWLTTALQAALLFYVATKRNFSAWGKNFQWQRSFYWLFIALLGAKLARPIIPLSVIPNLFDLLIVSFFLFVSLTGVWLAIIINDLNDEKIDQISNPSRPLVSGLIKKKKYQEIGVFLTFFFLIGLFLLSSASAFLLFSGELLYFFYSSQPFRLKRHFLTSSLVTGIAGLMIAMAGFFLFSQQQQLKAFPLSFILIIPIVLAFFSNVKDLKDYAGDFAANIKTVPVVFGQKKGALFIGLSFATIFAITPFLIQKYFLFLPMLMLANLIYFAITRTPYQEKYIFPFIYLYFLLVIIFI